MAKFKSNVLLENKILREEDLIKQGDFVFCDASGSGALDFWGIYSNDRIVALDGGGDSYIIGKIYLNQRYNYWTITHRIPCNKAVITIDEE